MGKELIIVESPAKVKTIRKFLGPVYVVKASVGHVRDLPSKTLGVDEEHGFEPQYQIIADKKNIVSDLQNEAGQADVTYLAPDPDREGEAIAWHIAELLKGKAKDLKRIQFNEITSRAVKEALEAARGSAAEVIYVRSGEQRSTTLTPVWDVAAAQWRAGMWVRDSSAGVGTLTFVDPEKGVFAGLGHPISDGDTGESIALRSGEIVPCEITGCSMGTVGSPGELKGKFLSAHAIGSIRINGENGVYGTTRTGFSGQTMPVAFAQEVETGDAQILATVAGETPRTYHVRIEKISDADPRRNMVVRVVDKALLSRTGGIVQGMSGSPILQNGRLVGAVTHVLVNDPTRGYGIFAQTMLEQAEQVATAEK